MTRSVNLQGGRRRLVSDLDAQEARRSLGCCAGGLALLLLAASLGLASWLPGLPGRWAAALEGPVGRPWRAPVVALGALTLAGAIALCAPRTFARAVSRRRAFLAQLARALEGQLTDRGGATRVSCTLDGVPVVVSSWTDPAGRPDADTLDLHVPSPGRWARSRTFAPRGSRLCSSDGDHPGLPGRPDLVLSTSERPSPRTVADVARLLDEPGVEGVVLDERGLTVVSPATEALLDLGRTRRLLGAAVALARALRAAPPAPAEVVVSAREAASICPYCRSGVTEARTCASCGTDHHAVCLEEHGGCAVFGCDRAPRRGAPQLDKA